MAGMDANLGVGGGLPPLQQGPSLDDEEKAMRKGKGRMLAGLIAIAVVILAGAGFLLSEDSEQRTYAELGKKINGMRREHFDQFWGCALQGEDLRDLKTNADVVSGITQRAVQGRAAYGRHVRDICMDILAGIETKLDLLVPPKEFEADYALLKSSVEELRSAWSDYISYLLDTKTEYSEEVAQPKLSKISHGWFNFVKAHASINQILKKKLKK